MRMETVCVHGGYRPEPTTKAVAVPVYQTTSYAFDNAQHGADLFNLKVDGNIYTRIGNPTNKVLEERLSLLEGGVGGLAVASGMAAITYAILTLAEQGHNIVSTSTLYGGTYNLFAHTFPTVGIEVRFGDGRDPASLAGLIDDNTRAVYCESVGNPLGDVADIEVLAGVAHAAGVPLIVDNTVPTPFLCRPSEWGADIVVHSLTKYLGGHGTSIGGALVDIGSFVWADQARKYPRLCAPDPSYHDTVYTEAFGPAAFIARARTVPLRNMGAPISPFNTFLILQGIETLPLRMERICQNASALAAHLAAHSQVRWVKYPGLDNAAQKSLVEKYLGGRGSGILSFGIAGGAEAGARFLDALQLFTRLVNIGDVKSLATHPASTTHRQLGPDELQKAGVSEDMVRLSIGIEHQDDLIADLDQALALAGR